MATICKICHSREHGTASCPRRTISVELTLREYLRVMIIRKYGSQEAAAKALNYSNNRLSQYLNGDREPPDALLAEFGIQSVLVATAEVAP